MLGGPRRAGYPPQVGPGVLLVRRSECPSGRVPSRRLGDRRWVFFSSMLEALGLAEIRMTFLVKPLSAASL